MLFVCHILPISIPLWFDWELVSKFQFHYGSIGSSFRVNTEAMIRNFNSTMVRLGASSSDEASDLGTNFNSTMVRLGAV